MKNVWCGMVHSKVVAWARWIGCEGEMFIQSLICHLPAFMQDLGGPFGHTVGLRHGGVQN